MAGYLEKYGAGEERREKITKRIVLLVVALLVVGGLVYSIFHNYPEEHQAKRFFDFLKARNYQSAYALWGCTAEKPCRDYPFTEFMKDWGPDVSPVNDFDVLDGESCGSGVIVDVDAGKAGDKKLWVERSTRILGFPPYERCPQGNRLHDFWRNIRYRLHGRPIPPEGS
ncbi:MAG TPA: hypothetical protein VLY24_25020 [Bryobacteraceae bacterium]|nr:hypothetical protein [Bryobacteraceae bacterium]